MSQSSGSNKNIAPTRNQLRQMAAQALASKNALVLGSSSNTSDNEISIGNLGLSQQSRQDYDQARTLKNDELRAELVKLGITIPLNRLNKDQLIKQYLQAKQQARDRNSEESESANESEVEREAAAKALQKKVTAASVTSISNSKKRKRSEMIESNSEVSGGEDHETILQTLGRNSRIGTKILKTTQGVIEAETNNEQIILNQTANFPAAKQRAIPAFLMRAQTQTQTQQSLQQNSIQILDQVKQPQAKLSAGSDHSPKSSGSQMLETGSQKRPKWFDQSRQQKLDHAGTITSNDVQLTKEQVNQSPVNIQTSIPAKIENEQEKTHVQKQSPMSDHNNWRNLQSQRNERKTEKSLNKSLEGRQEQSPKSQISQLSKLSEAFHQGRDLSAFANKSPFAGSQSTVLPRAQIINEITENVTKTAQKLIGQSETNKLMSWKERLIQKQLEALQQADQEFALNTSDDHQPIIDTVQRQQSMERPQSPINRQSSEVQILSQRPSVAQQQKIPQKDNNVPSALTPEINVLRQPKVAESEHDNSINTSMIRDALGSESDITQTFGDPFGVSMIQDNQTTIQHQPNFNPIQSPSVITQPQVQGIASFVGFNNTGLTQQSFHFPQSSQNQETFSTGRFPDSQPKTVNVQSINQRDSNLPSQIQNQYRGSTLINSQPSVYQPAYNDSLRRNQTHPNRLSNLVTTIHEEDEVHPLPPRLHQQHQQIHRPSSVQSDFTAAQSFPRAGTLLGPLYPQTQSKSRANGERGSHEPPVSSSKDKLFDSQSYQMKQSQPLIRRVDTINGGDNGDFALGRLSKGSRMVERVPSQIKVENQFLPPQAPAFDNVSMTSKLSTVSRVEDKKLNFVQRMLTLITAVFLILGLAYIKSTFFKPQAKYCPDSLLKADLDIINHSQSCSEDDQIFQKNLTVQCLKFKGCIPCPNHGFCSDNGTLSGCKPTYEIKNKICVENEEIANAAHTLLWEFGSELQRKLALADYRHGCLNHESKYESYEDFENFTISRFQNMSLKSNIQSVQQKMVYFLNADLTRHYNERIYDIWTQRDNESNRTQFSWNMNGYNFYASTPDYSIKEYIYVQYIRDYLVAIVLTTFSIVWLYRKVISSLYHPLSSLQLSLWKRSRRQLSTIQRLFKLVKGELRDKVGTIQGISQSDILRTYLKMSKASEDDGLKRDEETFMKTVWPKLEGERKRDKSIKTYERMQFGKEVPVWTLN